MANVGGVVFGTDVPATVDNADGTTYCMGTRFSSDADGKISQVHWRVPTNSPGAVNASVLPIQVQLWKRATTSLVASGTFSALTLGEWNHLLVNWPIEADVDYICSAVIDRYAATSHYFDTSKTNGHITAPAQAGMFVDLGPTGTTPVMPNTQFNGGGYFIDFDFAVNSTGPTFAVWNGSAEVPATVKLWDGSSEVAVAFDSIV
jgi:hypothetical protein